MQPGGVLCLWTSCTRQSVLQVLEQLGAHLAQWSCHVAFPELAHLPLVQLRSFAKSCKVERFRTASRALADAIQRNAAWVAQKRDAVDFSPKDASQVANFLRKEFEGKHVRLIACWSSMVEQCSELFIWLAQDGPGSGSTEHGCDKQYTNWCSFVTGSCTRPRPQRKPLTSGACGVCQAHKSLCLSLQAPRQETAQLLTQRLDSLAIDTHLSLPLPPSAHAKSAQLLANKMEQPVQWHSGCCPGCRHFCKRAPSCWPTGQDSLSSGMHGSLSGAYIKPRLPADSAGRLVAQKAKWPAKSDAHCFCLQAPMQKYAQLLAEKAEQRRIMASTEELNVGRRASLIDGASDSDEEPAEQLGLDELQAADAEEEAEADEQEISEKLLPKKQTEHKPEPTAGAAPGPADDMSDGDEDDADRLEQYELSSDDEE